MRTTDIEQKLAATSAAADSLKSPLEMPPQRTETETTLPDIEEDPQPSSYSETCAKLRRLEVWYERLQPSALESAKIIDCINKTTNNRFCMDLFCHALGCCGLFSLMVHCCNTSQRPGHEIAIAFNRAQQARAYLMTEGNCLPPDYNIYPRIFSPDVHEKFAENNLIIRSIEPGHAIFAKQRIQNKIMPIMITNPHEHRSWYVTSEPDFQLATTIKVNGKVIESDNANLIDSQHIEFGNLHYISVAPCTIQIISIQHNNTEMFIPLPAGQYTMLAHSLKLYKIIAADQNCIKLVFNDVSFANKLVGLGTVSINFRINDIYKFCKNDGLSLFNENSSAIEVIKTEIMQEFNQAKYFSSKKPMPLPVSVQTPKVSARQPNSTSLPVYANRFKNTFSSTSASKSKSTSFPVAPNKSKNTSVKQVPTAPLKPIIFNTEDINFIQKLKQQLTLMLKEKLEKSGIEDITVGIGFKPPRITSIPLLNVNNVPEQEQKTAPPANRNPAEKSELSAPNTSTVSTSDTPSVSPTP